ncbi:MAG: hypothetical protein HY074_10500 [Deltaproteobacteria bacterium]|nr:hypothetical protein [Deltaproteobacteria bacterium]
MRASKSEYLLELKKINAESEQLNAVFRQLSVEKKSDSEHTLDLKGIISKSESVRTLLHKHDPIALKNAFKNLFEAILVRADKTNGTLDLTLVLKRKTPTLFLPSHITGEEKSSVGSIVVDPIGRFQKLVFPRCNLA